MKEFGVQLYSIRNEFTSVESTRAAFRALGSFGYTQAQTAGTYDYIAPELFREYADEAGIRFVGTHYSWDRMVSDVEGTVRYHKILGTDEIGIGGFGTPTFESLKEFIRDFNELGEKYAKYGMKLSYHNHSGEFSNQFKEIEGKTKFDYLMEGLDPRYTCFNLDAGWAHLAGVDVYDLMKKLEGRVNILHIKDIQADYEHVRDGVTFRGPERIEIGRGNMNFKGIVKAAEAAGVRYFVVEDEFYSTGNPVESVKMSADYIKANLLEK